MRSGDTSSVECSIARLPTVVCACVRSCITRSWSAVRASTKGKVSISSGVANQKWPLEVIPQPRKQIRRIDILERAPSKIGAVISPPTLLLHAPGHPCLDLHKMRTPLLVVLSTLALFAGVVTFVDCQAHVHAARPSPRPSPELRPSAAFHNHYARDAL